MPQWQKIEAVSQVTLDAKGRTLVEVSLEGRDVPVGLCRANVLRVSGSPELVEDLLLARLQTELNSTNPIRISESQMKSDWELLQGAREANQARLDAKR